MSPCKAFLLRRLQPREGGERAMRMMIKMLAGAAGLATFAAAPAAAQYPYGYNNGYGQYGYNNYAYGANTNAAAQQCSAAVQSRLANRTSLGGIIGSLVGIPVG